MWWSQSRLKVYVTRIDNVTLLIYPLSTKQLIIPPATKNLQINWTRRENHNQQLLWQIIRIVVLSIIYIYLSIKCSSFLKALITEPPLRTDYQSEWIGVYTIEWNLCIWLSIARKGIAKSEKNLMNASSTKTFHGLTYKRMNTVLTIEATSFKKLRKGQKSPSLKTSRSEEKRTSIFPTGVMSKKVFIGAFMIFFMIN